MGKDGKTTRARAKKTDWRTVELKDRILNAMENGQSFCAACRAEDLNPPTVIKWIRKEYRDEYEEAQKIRALVLEDQIIEEGDNDFNDVLPDGKSNAAAVARSRLKCDNRKWLLGKMNPKHYGEQVNVGIKDDSRISETVGLFEGDFKQDETV